jgi:hypothetical protein
VRRPCDDGPGADPKEEGGDEEGVEEGHASDGGEEAPVRVYRGQGLGIRQRWRRRGPCQGSSSRVYGVGANLSWITSWRKGIMTSLPSFSIVAKLDDRTRLMMSLRLSVTEFSGRDVSMLVSEGIQDCIHAVLFLSRVGDRSAWLDGHGLLEEPHGGERGKVGLQCVEVLLGREIRLKRLGKAR